MNKININCIILSSYHLSSFIDLKNLVLSSSSFKNLFEQFESNPIEINQSQRKYFINLKTLNLYNSTQNEFLDDTNISKRIYWQCVTFR